MDAPQLAQQIGASHQNRLTQGLIRQEQQWYRAIILPELLIVLRLDPDIAVQRKTDEAPDAVHRRSTEIWGLDWVSTPAHVIDVDRSAADVLAELKRLIWSSL